MLTHHARPDQAINVLDRLDLRWMTPIPTRYPATSLSSMGQYLINTVVLGIEAQTLRVSLEA